MGSTDPRDPYVRARRALDDLIAGFCDEDQRLGTDELARKQHERNARYIADLMVWSETAQSLADDPTGRDCSSEVARREPPRR